MPDTCPLETARLLEMQSILGDRVGTDTFMYSITIDPERDTPEVLAQYAKDYGVGPGWLFLTGDEEDITLIRKKLGLYIDEIQAPDSNDHNVSIMIGNQRTGRWMRRSPFENPYVLATHVGDWLHNWKHPRQSSGEDYDHAPKIRQISDGESLFRTRCSACHVIGFSDDGQVVEKPGPNLFGVTERRDRDWLARWLKEPDRMLAEGDPTAIELYGAFNGLPMPNLRLKGSEIEELLAYMESESRRIGELKATIPEHKPAAPGEEESCCQKGKVGVLGSRGRDERSQDQRAFLNLAAIDLGAWLRVFPRWSRISLLLGMALALYCIVVRWRKGRNTGAADASLPAF